MSHNTQKQLAAAAEKLGAQQQAVTPKKRSSLSFLRSKKYIVVCSVIFVGLVVLLTAAIRNTTTKSTPNDAAVVPTSISKQVDFPLYYPDPTKMPQGYTLDRNSFSTNGQVVLFSVSHEENSIAFSLQKKPSADNLATFYKNQLQLRTETEVPLGKAAVGALNSQRFLSLPTKTDTWIIVTAPMDTNPDTLTELVKNLRQ